MADIEEMLGSVPLFGRLKSRDLKRLAERMTERSFQEGHAITVEGKGGIGFFVIDQGSATVTVGDKTVRTLGPGDHFGEIALIDEGPRSATITAVTDLRCHHMTSWNFRPLVQKHPEIAWSLLETLAVRLREAELRGE